MLADTVLLVEPRASAVALVLLVDTQRLSRLLDPLRQTALHVMLAGTVLLAELRASAVALVLLVNTQRL